MDINGEELLKTLGGMADQDPEGFCKLIMESINNNQRAVIDDNAPSQIKIRALNKLRGYFESIEDYENCQVLTDLINQLKDGSK